MLGCVHCDLLLLGPSLIFLSSLVKYPVTMLGKLQFFLSVDLWHRIYFHFFKNSHSSPSTGYTEHLFWHLGQYYLFSSC